MDYEVLEPVTDPVAALEPGAPRLHSGGNLVRHLKIRKGEPAPAADVVVTGRYEIGMQDQAFLGPEAGLAVPDGAGGVELFVSTQWLHVDQQQICAALGLPPEQVRLVLAGVGGAFGGREDLSMHVHACLLALHTGKPVKMMYSREESFFGHVHRHPAQIRYEHGANRDGSLVYVRSAIYLDGGAYASSTTAVVGNAGTMGAGPYVVPNVHIDAYGVYTNNPPCGAMRGFGSVQAAFGYEAQMDKLAAALGMDPVEFRCQNAMEQGSAGPTGQVIDSPAPVAEMLHRVSQMPLPAGGGRDRRRPGPADAARRRRQHDARRGHRPRDRLCRRLQERRILRGLRRLLDRTRQARGRRRRAGRDRPHRGRRGRPGTGHDRAADLPYRARRRQRGGRPEGHRRRVGRIHVRVAPDLRHRGRGQGGVRAGPRAPAGQGLRAAAARPVAACGWPTARSGPGPSRWGRSRGFSART